MAAEAGALQGARDQRRRWQRGGRCWQNRKERRAAVSGGQAAQSRLTAGSSCDTASTTSGPTLFWFAARICRRVSGRGQARAEGKARSAGCEWAAAGAAGCRSASSCAPPCRCSKCCRGFQSSSLRRPCRRAPFEPRCGRCASLTPPPRQSPRLPTAAGRPLPAGLLPLLLLPLGARSC